MIALLWILAYFVVGYVATGIFLRVFYEDESLREIWPIVWIAWPLTIPLFSAVILWDDRDVDLFWWIHPKKMEDEE